MNRLRKAWWRARVRYEAERQGASREQAKQAADVLYPRPGQTLPTSIYLDPAPGVRPYDPDGPYV